jgi:hypothetical protein
MSRFIGSGTLTATAEIGFGAAIAAADATVKNNRIFTAIFIWDTLPPLSGLYSIFKECNCGARTAK